MELDKNELEKIDTLLQKSRRILIIPHKAPDGDTIGASLAFYQILKQMGKAVEITCMDPPADVFNFMPTIEAFRAGEPRLDYDAYLIVDAGATHLTGFHESHPELFDKTLEVINIDHHQSNDFYGKYNVVVSDAASATMVLYELFTALRYPIDRHTATCLLTGIYTDTGSFMHSNTSADVLRVSARLLAKGANLRGISKEIFNTTKVSTMRLWGRVMKNTHQNDEGVTMSVVMEKDFADTGADYSEMTGVVDYINSVPSAKYSVILTEKEGKVKGSLRTLREEVNVADIASAYGGGGHTKAAGFTLPGHLKKEVRWKVVQ
ncbi:bifunctional oligoribonuclease/PAP phosphatase NrnA [Patescibacteria group bacterium]|nr:bifunctional oligoribonuclease/PAP phosphatase NrnA [Patescibacteria group bacterium]